LRAFEITRSTFNQRENAGGDVCGEIVGERAQRRAEPATGNKNEQSNKIDNMAAALAVIVRMLESGKRGVV